MNPVRTCPRLPFAIFYCRKWFAVTPTPKTSGRVSMFDEPEASDGNVKHTA